MARKTDLQIDKRGRLTVPKAIRKQLGIEHTSADVRVEISVIEKHE